ncbi:hypothetical protein J7F01_35290 [Streptomyces sp. ISL-22]|uniref:hypothetical protein n=1 Tax=unclassified Streptomyces TaxID=2593676 RepID=UPI001BE50325|nr:MULTISPECIES: hypothetical protein [unclassified Streptomyces]MBT2421304.1 hypothetical protein [Streptomyces sp. ISL-24]MBT2437328.1 hypothetical protein [Streptomyces sp. ISL-22]
MRSPIAFRCEAVAHDLSGTREVLLATYRGWSPRLAARWLRAEAFRLARLLSPHPGAKFLGNAPLTTAGPDVPRPDAELRAWASSDQAYEHALRTLAAGRAFIFTVMDYDARYSIRVYALPTRRPAPPQAPVPARHPRKLPSPPGAHPTPWRGRAAIGDHGGGARPDDPRPRVFPGSPRRGGGLTTQPELYR